MMDEKNLIEILTNYRLSMEGMLVLIEKIDIRLAFLESRIPGKEKE